MHNAAVFLLLYVILALLCVFFIAALTSPIETVGRVLIGREAAQLPKPQAFSHRDRVCNVALMGDSLALGVGSTSYEHTIAANIFRVTKCNVDVFAKSGRKLEHLDALIPPIPSKYNAAVIVLGGNDFAMFETTHTTKEAIDRAVMRSMERVRTTFQPMTRIIWVTFVHPSHLPTLATNLLKSSVKDGWTVCDHFRQAMTTYGKKRNVYVENFEGEDMEKTEGLVSSDGLHPSNEGYKAMAARIIKKLK